MGWAFAWRTLIAAELVFGVPCGKRDLGGHIFESHNQLATSKMFADLFFEMIIGLLAGNYVFVTIEKRTVGRWGKRHEALPAF